MRRVTVLLSLLPLLLVAAQVAAQDARLDARLDSTTRALVILVMDSARREALPTEPIVQKALEGSSKGASGARITAAVGTVLDNLRRARSALGTSATADELVAGAAAIRAGATPAMVTEIGRINLRGGVAVPLAVFTDLVAGGVSVDAAWRSVEDLAERGGDPQDFLDLRDRLRPSMGSP